MRFVGFTETGGPEVLRLMSGESPAPGPEEVLIRVAFAGVNFAEVQHRRGEFGEPEGVEVPGLEVSGTLAALGEKVTGLRIGDSVAAYLPAFGGYAELVVAPASFVYPTRGLDLQVAAGFPCVGPTAYGVLHRSGRLRAGEVVLVHAAAGGVGSMAVQLARAAGAGLLIATVGSTDKIGPAADLGYDHVLLRNDFPDAVRRLTGGRGVDLVLDPIGGPVRAASVELLAPFGRLVAFGDAGRHEDLTFGVRELWKRNVTVGGYNIADLARRDPATLAADARAALALLRDGEVDLPATVTYPMAEVVEAHRRLEGARSTGKAVLAVGG